MSPRTHLQLGTVWVLPRGEIIWENIGVRSAGESCPRCRGEALRRRWDLGSDPGLAKPPAGDDPLPARMTIFATGASIWIATWKFMGWICVGKGPALDMLEGAGQDQGCDGAGAALGVSPCAGVASTPLPVTFHGRSREPEQSTQGGSRRSGCPGLDLVFAAGQACCSRPASYPWPLRYEDLGGDLMQKAACWLLCTRWVMRPHAEWVVLPCCPSPYHSMSPHVPTVCPCCWHSCTYGQQRGHGVLLYSAACCATPSCTSHKHPAPHNRTAGSRHTARPPWVTNRALGGVALVGGVRP